MKISKNICGFILQILVYSNCVTRFDPPSIGNEDLLVVDAFLSNDDHPFRVKLSRTTAIDTTAFIPELGANIELISNQGERFDLYESGSGEYLSNTIINPLIGVGYKLYITTLNGNQYESDLVTMRQTPKIDSVTFRYEEKPEAGLKGIQIYVNTHDPANNTWYYRWEWEETWYFTSAFESRHIYDNGQIFLRDDDIYRCWKNHTSTSIRISTSKNLKEDIISRLPLFYVSTETDRLGRKYSVNVKQYALSEESYNYWLELEKVTESLGTLFDPQPSTVYSNLRNINNDSEIVLGYFDASSVEEERLFVGRDQLPFVRIPNYYRDCEDSIVSRGAVPEMIMSGYMLAYESQNDFGSYIYIMSSPWCIDCTISGSNVKPEFWE